MTITSMDIAEHIVNRGAAMLDQYVPDWASRINVETLNINSAATCLVAQLLGKVGDTDDHDYVTGLDRLKEILADSEVKVEWYFGVAHGFMTSWVRRDNTILDGLDLSEIEFDSDDEVYMSSLLLTGAWRTAIAERVTVAV